jgi:hypothetical protein
MVRRQVRQIETRHTKINDVVLHAVTAHDAAQKRQLALVINNQTKPITHEGRDMQGGFRGTDDRNIDSGLSSVNSQIQGAEGYHGVVTRFFRAFEALNKCRRY